MTPSWCSARPGADGSEASFNASAQLSEDSEKVRRLLICRSPWVRFTAQV